MKPHPPKLADRILEMFYSDWYLEEIQGDLHEWFEYRLHHQGAFRARIGYFFDVLRSLRTYRFKKHNELVQNSNNNAMLKNYFLLAVRTLWRKRAFSALNLGGLIIAFTAFLLLFQYVFHEHSYDLFLEDHDRLFRIQTNRYNKGELSTQWAAGAAGAGVLLSENFEEVEAFTTLHEGPGVISWQDRTFKEDHIFFVTANFFETFSIPLIHGDRSSVLNPSSAAVLSESTARKYFGEEDPIGKTVKWQGRHSFEVTGVFEDIPENSHMKIDILLPFEFYVDRTNETARTNMFWDGFMTYVKLQENASASELEAKIPDLIYSTVGEDLTNFDENMAFVLQPVPEIHQTSNLRLEFKKNGNKQATTFLLIVAVFILFIAWINYINLSTAKSLERAREVGIRKVLGSYRAGIMKQFIMEALVLNITAFAGSVLLFYLLLPAFGDLAGRPLQVVPLTWTIWLILLLSVVAGSFLSGFYPAFVLSGFLPTRVLKGRFVSSQRGVWLRKSLVVVQFAISMILMIGTYTVYQQLQFLKSQELGVNLDQVLVLEGPGATDSTFTHRANGFRNSVGQLAQVKKISNSSHVPGSQPGFNAGGIRLITQPREDGNQYRVILMDEGFIPLHDLEVLEGRNFSNAMSGESDKVIITEAAAELLGIQDYREALHQKIDFWRDTLEIIGVVKDYHHEYMKKAYDPMIFRYQAASDDYFSIQVGGRNMESTVSAIEDMFKQHFPNNPFHYFFLDQHYDQQYRADQQFMKIFGIFSVLAIIIACLGLFGLTSYYTLQKTREISIRKVLGASSFTILSRLSRDMVLTMFLAVIISVPVAWWLMNQWLAEFAFRMNLSPWLFFVPALALLLIAAGTMSYQTIKAALTNPATALRSE